MPDLSASELHERVGRRVLGPEGRLDARGGRAFLFREVSIGSRRADAVAVGKWRSRGQLIEGFEYKVRRDDWLGELEDHGKAEPTMAICDRFWLVTNPGVAELHEIPEPWGWLVSDGRRRNLKVEKPAPALRSKTDPLLTREALVRLLRCAEKEGGRGGEEAYAEARKQAREGVAQELKEAKAKAEREREFAKHAGDGWEAFHRALGLSPWQWGASVEDLELLGTIAGAIREGGGSLERLYQDLERHEATAGDIVGRMATAKDAVAKRLFADGES